MSKHILFICSRNQWRSPTGERVWREQFQRDTRSAGTSPNAKRVVSINDIRWADVILCMEEKHKSRIVATFRQLVQHKDLVVLDIPDEYKYMDSELVSIFIDIGKDWKES